MAISVCAACHQSFASLGSFDHHRVGSHSLKTRRCMSPAEMLSARLTKSKHWHLAEVNVNFDTLRKASQAIA